MRFFLVPFNKLCGIGISIPIHRNDIDCDIFNEICYRLLVSKTYRLNCVSDNHYIHDLEKVCLPGVVET